MRPQREYPEVRFAEKLGGRIFQTRRRLNLTREQLGERSGINCSLIYRIEHGQSTPSAFVLFALAGALEVAVEDLYPHRRGMHEGDPVPLYSTAVA